MEQDISVRQIQTLKKQQLIDPGYHESRVRIITDDPRESFHFLSLALTVLSHDKPDGHKVDISLFSNRDAFNQKGSEGAMFERAMERQCTKVARIFNVVRN